MQIRPTTVADIDGLLDLYQRVAEHPGGLARLAHEIDRRYVEHFVSSSLASGLGLTMEDEDGTLVGEIHAWSNGLHAFAHVLSELTIAVDPSTQGRGVGRRLFEHFLATVRDEHPGVLRVELVARESNARALAFYETLGFEREGAMRGRIRGPDGGLEADIPMAWLRD